MRKKVLILLLIMAALVTLFFKSPLRKLLFVGIFQTLPPVHLRSNLPQKFVALLQGKKHTYLINDVSVTPMNQDTIPAHCYVLIDQGKITQIAQSKDSSAQSGTVEVGKTVDLLLLDKNPLLDIRHTQHIAGVFVKGKWLNRKLLAQILAEVKASYKNR